MYGRGRAGKVVDLVDLDVEWKCDIMTHQLEVRAANETADVVLGARKIVINAEYIVTVIEQPFTEM
jgi:hypothetical protein